MEFLKVNNDCVIEVETTKYNISVIFIHRDGLVKKLRYWGPDVASSLEAAYDTLELKKGDTVALFQFHREDPGVNRVTDRHRARAWEEHPSKDGLESRANRILRKLRWETFHN